MRCRSDAIDLSNPQLFQSDTVWPYLERLRREAPVHYREGGLAGSFWSVTKYKDIMAVDTNHALFSSASAQGGITIYDAPPPRCRYAYPLERRFTARARAPEEILNQSVSRESHSCEMLKRKGSSFENPHSRDLFNVFPGFSRRAPRR